MLAIKFSLKIWVFFTVISASCTVFGEVSICEVADSIAEKPACEGEQLASLDAANLGGRQLTQDRARAHGQSTRLTDLREEANKRRNDCQEEDCPDSIASRERNEEDPFLDNNVTCAEMRKYPGLVFTQGIDLGSGNLSPIGFNYGCEDSLASLPFLKSLAKLSENVRTPSGSQLCPGSSRHAKRRYFEYRLAGAGIAPKVYFSSVRNRSDTDTLKYFQQWSWQSTYNYYLYSKYFEEFEKAHSQLTAHYIESFGYSDGEARSIARRALMIYVNRAAGSFPRHSLKDPSTLVDIAADETSSEADLRQAIAKFANGSQLRQHAYKALKVALLHDKPRPFLSLLLDVIGTIDDETFNEGSESVLFFALPDTQKVLLLLDRGASVDYANAFGKTPLFYAIGFNDHQLVETLLQHGADPNHPYKSAKEINPNNSSCNEYKFLRHTKRTPLMHAAQHSDIAMMRLLIENGAKANVRDEIGFNAMDYALMGENPGNREFLFSIGLELQAPKYPLSVTGRTVPKSSQEEALTVPLNGFVEQLTISPQRQNILVASVISWFGVRVGPEHGLYLFSLQNPAQPRVLAHYPGIRVADFALSPDGNTAYVMHTFFKGADKDKQYGLLMIDISLLDAPKLLAFIEGDFMIMHLSRNGKFLFLQERNHLRTDGRGTVVVALDSAQPQVLCTKVFGKTSFAYGFATFPDEPLIAVNNLGLLVDLYDVTDPCNPDLKSSIPILDNYISGHMIGLSNRRIYSSAGGLMEYQLRDGLTKLSSWSGVSWPKRLAFNERLGLLAKVFAPRSDGVIRREIALVRLENSAGHSPIERYSLASPNIGGVAISDVGMLYVGVKDGLTTVDIKHHLH